MLFPRTRHHRANASKASVSLWSSVVRNVFYKRPPLQNPVKDALENPPPAEEERERNNEEDCEQVRNDIEWIKKVIETYEDKELQNRIKSKFGKNAVKEY